jgi:hypothetical protein
MAISRERGRPKTKDAARGFRVADRERGLARNSHQVLRELGAKCRWDLDFRPSGPAFAGCTPS